jgi:hypothetical protein
MTKWEYLSKDFDSIPWTMELDKLGESGWELVTMVRREFNDDYIYECIFKRPKG